MGQSWGRAFERQAAGRPPAVVLGDLTLVRPLGMAGIPCIVVTDDAQDVALSSRYVRSGELVPGWSERARGAAAEVLLSLGARLHRDLGRRVLLVHGSDLQVELLRAHREELSEHYLFLLNDEALERALLDKRTFYELAEAAGIKVPRTRTLASDLGELRAPLLVKPRRKTRWKEIQRDLLDGPGKARVFATKEELFAHPAFERHRDELIVQEQVRSAEGGLVSFHGFADERGRLLASFCGRKLRTWPVFAGESAFIELSSDAQADATGRRIVERLGLRGPFKIDLVREARTGELFVLEINARFNLWHYLGAVHGVNLPAVAYEHLVERADGDGGRSDADDASDADDDRATARDQGADGEPSPEPRYRWLDLYRDYHAFRELHRKGSLSLLRWLSSLVSLRNVHGTFAWDDPVPAVRAAVNFIRRRISSWRAMESSRTFTATSKPCALP